MVKHGDYPTANKDPWELKNRNQVSQKEKDEHYFQQDPVTKSYSLSFRFLELGSRVQQQTHLTSIARPHLERLMAETRESINLAVWDGDSAVYLDTVHSSYSMLQLFTRPGARVPPTIPLNSVSPVSAMRGRSETL